MTREEAIETLKSTLIMSGRRSGKCLYNEAVRMAIEALSADEDTISRQAAIDALKEHRNLFCDNTPDTFSVLPYGDKCRVDELDMAIATLINLPSAQLEHNPDDERKIADLHKMVNYLLSWLDRKTGRWINHRCDDGHHIADCDQCGHTLQWFDDDTPKFCCECGARMLEVKHD